MLSLSIEKIIQVEQEVARQDIVKFNTPSKGVMDALLTPYKPFLTVESTGLQSIPTDGPYLFVSNHSLYGIEMPLLLNQLYQHKNIFPRALADHFHFATLNGPIIRAFGAVDGTRENVDALMSKGESVLVYPGGGHEVLKHCSVPRYELMWKQRVGFARCAIKHGYPILPCACVGTEDMFDPIYDIPTGYKGMVIPISVTTAKFRRCTFGSDSQSRQSSTTESLQTKSMPRKSGIRQSQPLKLE
jgi:1-acyl-sn-glycerol-3-phosphate acyltransferase